MNRRGYSLVELMTVAAFLGLLTGIAVPSYHRLRSRAAAAQAIAALHVVRTAAYGYMEATGTWPAGQSMGVIPADIAGYLPKGFTFDKPGLQMAWRHDRWVINGVEESSQMVQLETLDPLMCDAADRLLGGRTNPNLLSACNGPVGLITLFLDN